MAEEKDQTLETRNQGDDTDETANTETRENDESTKAAVEESEKFDELIDTEDVEETPSEDDKSESKEEDTADEEDTGDEETSEKADDTEKDDEPKISAELSKKAVKLGLTQQEVETFESDEELQRTVNILEDIIAEQEQDASPPAQTDKSKDQKDKEPESILKFTDEKDIDPEILQNLRNIEKHYQEQVKSLREEVTGMKAGLQQEEQNRFLQRFDGMFEKLGTEFTDVFGKGATNDLSRRSNAYKARDKVRGRMYAFAKGLSEAGESIPDEQQLFELAVTSLHGKKVKAVEGLRLNKKSKERSKQRLGRASTKKTGSMTGYQQAVQVSREFDDLIDTSED